MVYTYTTSKQRVAVLKFAAILPQLAAKGGWYAVHSEEPAHAAGGSILLPHEKCVALPILFDYMLKLYHILRMERKADEKFFGNQRPEPEHAGDARA